MEDTRAHDSPAPRYAFGPFLVDPVRRTIVRDGRLVPITSKTFDVLLVLLEYRDHTVEKDQLLSLVWPGTIVHENNLPRQVSSLRRALGQRPDRHDYIVTIPGQGYRFVATVDCLPEPGPVLHAVPVRSLDEEPAVDESAGATRADTDHRAEPPSPFRAGALTMWGALGVIATALMVLARSC